MINRITLAQINPIIGDIPNNVDLIRQACKQAANDRSDLVVFPELCITGYPPRDLLERTDFITQVTQAIAVIESKISTLYPTMGIIIGAPSLNPNAGGKRLYNSAFIISNGKTIGIQHKGLLPSYDVFDELRYFEPATAWKPIDFKGEKIGILICEDAWSNKKYWHSSVHYTDNPLQELAKEGTTLLISIAASPFETGKINIRHEIFQSHVAQVPITYIYVNQVGANDELIFDGGSFALNESGKVLGALPTFTESVQTIDRHLTLPTDFESINEIESLHQALVLGIRDYFRKTGFDTAILGLSGGIDSAVVACLAAEALGPDNVVGVALPSRYSSEHSVIDAKELAVALGIQIDVIDIDPIVVQFESSLNPFFEGTKPNIAEENIQARVRGNLLMALANKFGYLLLSTGNKSELAVGYCTLYGDMCGALSVLADVTKTLVYKLADDINAHRPLIPVSTLTKPPSAELRPNQTDQDTLPEYHILDDILIQYIEKRRSVSQIVASGHPNSTVKWVIQKIIHNEYKRRQAAPGLKVTPIAFGIGRRQMIAAVDPEI